MKNIIKKLMVLILFTIFSVNVTFVESNAASLENTMQVVNMNSEFEYKINFEKNLVAIDLVLIFEEEKLSIEEVLTEKVEYNQIENGKIILVYVDETGEGTDNISIKFKAKELTEENVGTKIKVENINAYSLENEEGYEDSELNIESLTEEVRIVEETIEEPEEKPEEKPEEEPEENKGSMNNEDSHIIVEGMGENTSADSGLLRLPNAGINNYAIIPIVIVIIIVAILIMKYKKIKSIIPIIVLGILFIGTVKTNAASGIFIKKYDNIKNFEKVIVIMPDETNRNLKKN